MKVDSETVEDLSKIVEIKTQEIKHWRGMINRHADGDDQLKQFEKLFNDTKEKFDNFKNLALTNDETAKILEIKLNNTLSERSKAMDSLRNDIQSLRRAIDNQTAENDLLEKKLREEAEKLNKFKYTKGHSLSYFNNSQTEGHAFIQRLTRELK